MFDETNEDPAEGASNEKDRAKEKADEFRMHAELAAVFEGVRKFGAQIKPGFDAEIARQVQRGMGKLEKAKAAEHPVLPEQSMGEAAELLGLAKAREIAQVSIKANARWPSGRVSHACTAVPAAGTAGCQPNDAQ